MGIWIEVEDVKKRWEEGSNPPSDALIEVTIEDTEDYLIVSGGTQAIIQGRIDSGVITDSTVDNIMSRAVIRTLQTPQNSRLTSWNEGLTGIGNQSQSLAEGPKNISLLSPSELSRLTGRNSTVGTKMGSISWVGGGIFEDDFAINRGY